VLRSSFRGFWIYSVVSMCDARGGTQTLRPQRYAMNALPSQPLNGFNSQGRGKCCQSCRCGTGNTTATNPQDACFKGYKRSRREKPQQRSKVSGKESCRM
jgi:hypothetical protein